MECPHLNYTVSPELDTTRFPEGPPSSWCCNVCKCKESSWMCLTCLQVHCGRYMNGHGIKHFENSSGLGQENGDIVEKEDEGHCVCMDSDNYSVFCYRCDEFVANDTELGLVQKIRERLQSLENQRKRKMEEVDGPENKIMKTNDGTTVAATGLRNLGNTCFMNAILQSLSNIEQFNCFFKELPAAAQLSGKAAGRMYHTRSQGDTSV